MGSATPQNTRPTPMPQPKSMANQVLVLYSGLESSGPSFMPPCLESAITMANTTKANMTAMYSQPKFTVKNENMALETAENASLKPTAATMITAQIASDTIKTVFEPFFSSSIWNPLLLSDGRETVLPSLRDDAQAP